MEENEQRKSFDGQGQLVSYEIFRRFVTDFVATVCGMSAIGEPPRPFVLTVETEPYQPCQVVLVFRRPDHVQNQRSMFILRVWAHDATCIWIDGMNAHPAGQKIGTQVLTRLLRAADAHGLDIMMRSIPVGESVESRELWLNRLGFEAVSEPCGEETHRRPSRYALRPLVSA